MKVMLITGKYPPQQCGIGDYTYRLAVELSKYGHDIAALTSSIGKGPILNGQGNVEVIREAFRWDFTDYPRIRDYVQGRKIEIVHIQYHAFSFHCHPMITLLPLLLKHGLRSASLKVVVTLHELAGPTTSIVPGPARRVWLLLLMHFSDAVIVTNERDLSYLQKIPLIKRRLHLIPLGSNFVTDIAQQADRSAARRDLGVADDETLLVRFGFLHNIRVSLIPQLLHALKLLLDQRYRVKLLMVGGEDAEGRKDVLSLAEDLRIEKHVLLTGYCSAEDVSRYLRSADIGVQPYPEGVCEKRSSLHAVLSHGLPVVSTRNGKVPSMFGHRKNIFLVPVDECEPMAEAITCLIEDIELRDTLAHNALKTMATFNWEAIGKMTDTLYTSSIIAAAHPRTV